MSVNLICKSLNSLIVSQLSRSFCLKLHNVCDLDLFSCLYKAFYLTFSITLNIAVMEGGDPFYDDSGDDIFITQTAPEYKDLEQDEEYDCSYLNSQYKQNWSVPLGEVEYWDFSNQPDNSSDVPSSPLKNDYTGPAEQVFDSLVFEEYFADGENVS